LEEIVQSPVPTRITAAAVLTILLTIAGCANTGGIAPQASATDAASLDAGNAIRAANADAQWPAADWWRAYNDPQLDAWIEAAQENNPSLAAAQARGIDVAKAEFYPDIDLLASIGGYAAMGPLFQFLKNPSHSWSAGPALSLPIFDGGRLRSQLGAASAGYDEAVERYNQSIVGALKDISDQVIRMRSLATQAQDADRSVAAARKNYDLSREGYRRGLTDYLNVLIAQNQLLRAQEGVARIQAERLGVHASLVTALGGGLDDPANGPQADQTLPEHGKGKGKAAVQPSNATAAKAAVAPAAIGTAGERDAEPAANMTPKRAAAASHADTGNASSAAE
jgi:outer membrane protein TolC